MLCSEFEIIKLINIYLCLVSLNQPSHQSCLVVADTCLSVVYPNPNPPRPPLAFNRTVTTLTRTQASLLDWSTESVELWFCRTRKTGRFSRPNHQAFSSFFPAVFSAKCSGNCQLDSPRNGPVAMKGSFIRSLPTGQFLENTGPAIVY